jgi:hypothetical protein
MIVDFPVAMTDFVNAPFGEFFVYFGDGDAELAMKIFDAVSPDKKAAVLSFTAPVHTSMTPPTVIEATGFLNRSVGVVRDVVIPPSFRDEHAAHRFAFRGSPWSDHFRHRRDVH